MKKIIFDLFLILIILTGIFLISNSKAQESGIIQGTLLNNANDLNPSYGREAILPIYNSDIGRIGRFSTPRGYYLRITSGSDQGKEYLINSSEFVSPVINPGLPGAFLMLRLNAETTATAGDTFEIYAPPESCGDNICLSLESCSSCSSDCGACQGLSCTSDSECSGYCVHGKCSNTWATCGDGFCDAGKEACGGNATYMCQEDCGVCSVGNGICDIDENCYIAPGDCGACECGNGVVNAGETTANCWADAGYPTCGDGFCDAGIGENNASCSWDCGDDYKTTVYDDFSGWTTYTGAFSGSSNHGRTFLISPTIYEGSNVELIHHWLDLDYTATSSGKVKALIERYTSDDVSSMMNGAPNALIELNSGEVTWISKSDTQKYAWIILEADQDVTLNSLSHKYLLGHSSGYGVKNGKFRFVDSQDRNYYISYPNNYDVNKSYPLVITEDTLFSYWHYTNFYFKPEFETFVLAVQRPPTSKADLLAAIPEPYYPHNGNVGAPTTYHQVIFSTSEGFWVSSIRALIDDMINNPGINIDTNRIYTTGFSGGVDIAYALARADTDLITAVWALSLHPIGTNWNRSEAELLADTDFIDNFKFDINNYYRGVSIQMVAGSNEPPGFVSSINFACPFINSNGGSCVSKIYPGWGHWTSPWGEYNEMSWMFAQSKSNNSSPIQTCNNSIVEGTEKCDNNTTSCSTLGFSRGTALCNDLCNGWMTSNCSISSFCGDGICNGAETCGVMNNTPECNNDCGTCSSFQDNSFIATTTTQSIKTNITVDSIGEENNEENNEESNKVTSSWVNLTRPLIIGSSSQDIKQIQILLNSLGFTVSTTGAGSPGNETGYYGNLTQNAIKKFQCAKSIVCSGTPSTTGYGAIGPKTRLALDKEAGTNQTADIANNNTKTNSSTTITNDANTVTRWLTVGTTGTDVKNLQIFLNANGYTITQSGPGSKGNETNYFGTLTREALQKFQCIKGIVCSGTPTTTGYGATGPKTRAVLDEKCSDVKILC